MKIFDLKIWNDEVFQKYLVTLPNTRLNKLISSGALRVNQSLASRLVDGVGGNTLVEPIKGRIGGDVLNYDGVTDLSASSRDTYMQKKIVVGRMKGFQEKDFSKELSGVDFKAAAQEVAEYYQDIDQEDLLAILKGVFAMTSTQGLAFVAKHTLDISAESNPNLEAGTLNTASQKAMGDAKGGIKLAFMHSVPATNLENLRLLDYLKYTDAQGIQRDLTIATWNGRLVFVDDQMPVEEVAATEDDPAYVKYTTYLLGEGAIEYANIGAKVPSELVRDAKTNGGIDILYTRQRKLYAPYGITWAGADSIISPTVAQLSDGANWDLVNNGLTSTAKKVIDDKLIPIARIISRG